jgi:hypothetical protein
MKRLLSAGLLAAALAAASARDERAATNAPPGGRAAPEAPAAPTGLGEPLAPAQVKELHAFLKPQPGESLWAQVPWMTSLREARKKAAAEGKPLFIWSIADGHPSGNC